MTDPEAVLRKHVRASGRGQLLPVCDWCWTAFPCETVELATALQEARDRAYGWELVAQENHEALVEAQAAGVMAWEAGVEFATAARIMSRRAEAAGAALRAVQKGDGRLPLTLLADDERGEA